MNKLLAIVAAGALGLSGAMAAAEPAGAEGKPLEQLTLEQAQERALAGHPALAEAAAAVEAAAGRAQQAGAFPNPEAILGANQLPLSSSSPNEREYVAGVGQSLPVSGRLSKARKAELLEREVRVRGLEARHREIRKGVHSAFAAALYQEKAHEAQEGILRNAEKAVATTRTRVEVGDAIGEDLARVEMELARAKVEMQRVETLRAQGLIELASAMGDATLSVKSLSGVLERTFEIPTIEALVANIGTQPEVAQARAELGARRARVDLARAERIPDVRVELLYHRLEATKSDTVDVGLSIPLPLFNRNQGRLREARAEAAAAEARARMSETELAARLRESHLRLTSALATSRAYKSDILTRAETVLKSAEARYEAGDTSLAEVLPVRRDWATVQLSYLESLREVMQGWAELALYWRGP